MPETKQELLPHLFRLEYSKMTAVLCRLFGLEYIELAEDIVSETFLKALEIWVAHGIPEHPTAWLYTVAKNKTKDYLKRNGNFEQIIKHQVLSREAQTEDSLVDFSERNIDDSQLEMIFMVCNPVNSDEAQICLALQILCGFSVKEIANAFLSNPETIKKRLLRARENLRAENLRLDALSKRAIIERLDNVMVVLYLLFNEGYFSKSHDKIVRKELCQEALRLAFILSKNDLTNTSKVNALIALMCFQSSRLEARASEEEEAILFDEQNKELWDQQLIDKGNYYFSKACISKELSKFHIEAGIAYWHTVDDSNKWQHILNLYDLHILSGHSPVTDLNRIFAFAKVYGNEQAVVEAEKLNQPANLHWHSLLGFLYTSINIEQAISHYNLAIDLSGSKVEKSILRKQIKLLGNKTRADF